ALLLQQRDGARGVVAHDGLVAGQPERARQRRERRLIVVDNQDARHDCSGCVDPPRPSGSSIWNVAPRPAVLSTQTRPGWSATTDCTIARPRPVPCCLVV